MYVAVGTRTETVRLSTKIVMIITIVECENCFIFKFQITEMTAEKRMFLERKQDKIFLISKNKKLIQFLDFTVLLFKSTVEEYAVR